MTAPSRSVAYRDLHGKSVGEILDGNRGVGRGFDILRVGLALVILMSHASGIIGHGNLKTEILNALFGLDAETAKSIASVSRISAEGPALTGLGRPITLALVPMFFALSGFLVSGSAFRTTQLSRFIGLRALRIVPALFVEVFLSAIVLGTWFTTLPLRDYFTSPLFWSYWLNILGEVHYYLPGVFEHTSASLKVNSNLWTLPYELLSYLVMSALIVTRLLHRRKLFAGLLAAVTVVLACGNSFLGWQVVAAHLPGSIAVYYFALGVAFYLFRYEIRFSALWFLASVAVAYPLMMFTRTVYIYPVFLVYITVFIGLFPFPPSKLLRSGDYSYGVYLYGYPVTQALVAQFPALKDSIAATVGLTFTCTALFACLSWHAVEKHCLKLKRWIAPSSARLEEQHHPSVAEATPALALSEAGHAADGPVSAG